MSGRILVQMQTPVTQKPEAVEALAAYLNKTIEAGVLDLGAAKLVKSNKGDAFYTVTAKACSCPAAFYHHGPCKHQRKYFPEVKTIRAMNMAGTLEQADKNLSKMPYQYQRMVKAAREAAESEPLGLRGDHKPFKPFIEDEAKAAEVA